MLDDLVEIETPDAIARAMQRMGHPGACGPGNGFEGLDYLFWGRAAGALPVWIAGGVTVHGHAVTGSGTGLDAALWGVLGETAEAHCRFAPGKASIPAPSDDTSRHGYGAHTDAARAMGHARREAIEREAVRQWWRGGRHAHRLPEPQVADALRALEMTAAPCPIALQIAAGPDLCVLVVADFDADGRGFRFGAACRDRLDHGLQAALLELYQARFALDLARMKRQRFGAAGLQAGDRTNLLLAERIERTDFLRLIEPGPLPTVSGAATLTAPDVALLGTYCNLMHVAEARLRVEAPLLSSGAFGIQCLYKGAA